MKKALTQYLIEGKIQKVLQKIYRFKNNNNWIKIFNKKLKINIQTGNNFF